MTYTLVTLFLVGIILLFWLYKLMCNCFCRSFCIWKSQKNGTIVPKEATILSINTIKSGKRPLLELLLVFENFSGYPIQRKIRVWDSKPLLNRFHPDDKIPIGLNTAKRPRDPVFLALGACGISFAVVLICCLKIIVYVSGCYILMGETLKRIWESPDYYESVFKESEMLEIFLVLLGVALLVHFLLKKIGLLETGRTRSQNWDLLYHGKGTVAQIKGQKDTGTKIQGRRIIQVNYVFTDERGQVFEGRDKTSEDLEKVSFIENNTLEIMYLPDNPFVSRLTENLESPDISKFTNTVFHIVMFLFSSILIGLFCHYIFG